MIKNDPFGMAISDYYQGNKKARISVSSTITDDEHIKVSKLFRTSRGMSLIEHTALGLCKGKILDVGAGSGTHSLVLQKKHFDVTALDLSPKACDVMEKRGVKNVVCGDIFKHDDGQYETILLLMNGVGIAGTLEGLDALLAHFKTILKIGGKIYLESTDIMYMFVEEDGSMLIDLNGSYYGELQYEISYGEHSSNFPWLYVDFGTLEFHAQTIGFESELLVYDGNFSYLACLTRVF